MAKTKQQQQQHLLVIYLTICLVVVSLLMNVDSVSALSMPLDGSGSVLQRQEQQQLDNNVQEHNYITNQANERSTTTVPKNPNTFEDDNDDNRDILKDRHLREDLTADQLNFGHPFKTNSIIKRSGFLGMRGKKLYNNDDDGIDAENNEDLDCNRPWNQLRDPAEDIDWNEYAQPNVVRYKKAPATFYGVRGKKFTTMDGVNSNRDNHRWHDFLQKIEEERVRDALLQDFVERLAGTRTDVTNDFAKRTPTGFTGVRGKRPFLDDEDDSSMESLTKRRLGNNAFVGVRGKKDVSHQTFKRSPAEAESLAGRNGKRQNLNNKFIAVRGKKTSYDETPSAAMSLLYDKRVPNGFVGMRGKRPFTTGDI